MSQTPEERAREAVLETMNLSIGEATCKHEDEEAWYAARRAENAAEIDAYRAAVRRAAFAECRAMVEAEPELPGAMPDAVWDRMRDSRQASEECLRAAVRATKRNILSNLTTMEDTP